MQIHLQDVRCAVMNVMCCDEWDCHVMKKEISHVIQRWLREMDENNRMQTCCPGREIGCGRMGAV
jgi:hypothetical protein